jgi:hypothetical protein
MMTVPHGWSNVGEKQFNKYLDTHDHIGFSHGDGLVYYHAPPNGNRFAIMIGFEQWYLAPSDEEESGKAGKLSDGEYSAQDD